MSFLLRDNLEMSNTSQEINVGSRKKNDCLIKLNENDWIFAKGVNTRNQRKITFFFHYNVYLLTSVGEKLRDEFFAGYI